MKNIAIILKCYAIKIKLKRMKMKGVDVSFKSKILKLSILIMLILVLIPVVAAENSTETFFQEYDVADDEVSVEEYVFTETYYSDEDTQAETSQTHEADIVCRENNQADDVIEPVGESILMNDDDVNILAENQDSVFETHDLVIEEIDQNTQELLVSDFEEIDDDVNETSDEGLTVDNIPLEKESFSIPVFKLNVIFNLSHFFGEMKLYKTSSFKTSSFGRYLIKNYENEEMILRGSYAVIFDNINGNVIICDSEDYNNKNIGDFIYSIDNSVIGEGAEIIFYAGFTYFDTIFTNELLTVFDELFNDDVFFAVDFLK